MKFEKALAVKMPYKASFYGPPGSGKTFTALLFAESLAKFRGGRIAYIDTELGTKAYGAANPLRKVHPEAFDFDRINTRSLADVLTAVRSLTYPKHAVLVVDSISHLWDAAREAWESKNPDAKGDIPLRAWSSVKRPYKDLIKFLIESPMDVLILGRQKSIFEEDENGKLRNAGVGMRAEAETQFEPDVCYRMELKGTRGEDDGIVTLFAEKDRHSVLAGRTIANPTGKTVEAYFPFIGTETPTHESDEERAEKDSELLDSNEKGRAKESKSASIMSDLSGKAQTAKTMEELGAIVTEAKKLKRSMVEPHVEALRLVLQNKTAELNESIAGSV